MRFAPRCETSPNDSPQDHHNKLSVLLHPSRLRRTRLWTPLTCSMRVMATALLRPTCKLNSPPHLHWPAASHNRHPCTLYPLHRHTFPRRLLTLHISCHCLPLIFRHRLSPIQHRHPLFLHRLLLTTRRSRMHMTGSPRQAILISAGFRMLCRSMHRVWAHSRVSKVLRHLHTCHGVGHAWQYNPFSSVVLVDYSGW